MLFTRKTELEAGASCVCLKTRLRAIFDWSNRCWLSRIREEAFFPTTSGSREQTLNRRGMRRGPAGGATLATSRLVAPSRVVGLQPTGHLPQVGEAMRPRSEVGSLFVAASNADGGVVLQAGLVGLPLCVGPLRRPGWTDVLLLVGIAVEVARPDGETLAVQVEELWHAVGGVFWPMVRMMLRKRAAVA